MSGPQEEASGLEIATSLSTPLLLLWWSGCIVESPLGCYRGAANFECARVGAEVVELYCSATFSFEESEKKLSFGDFMKKKVIWHRVKDKKQIGFEQEDAFTFQKRNRRKSTNCEP